MSNGLLRRDSHTFKRANPIEIYVAVLILFIFRCKISGLLRYLISQHIDFSVYSDYTSADNKLIYSIVQLRTTQREGASLVCGSEIRRGTRRLPSHGS